MKISSRSQYGMRAILALARNYGNAPLQTKTIAENEDISQKYLEQVIHMLKVDGLLGSVRGPRGGYSLTKPPEEIKLKDVFLVLEGPMVSAECPDHSEYISGCADCTTNEIWQELQGAITGVLESVTLADLIDGSNRFNETDTGEK